MAYAMEYNLAAKLSVWDDGLKEVITDKVHYINPLTKQLRVEVKPGEFVLVAFNNIVGVAVSVEDKLEALVKRRGCSRFPAPLFLLPYQR
ncbi:YolD-like family protein [Neobacillus drentensis]|uniref:YolD-like family protein n=1 Tax=Neobacillus drentensis TaxID=220684 RepID=UPI003001C1DB